MTCLVTTSLPPHLSPSSLHEPPWTEAQWQQSNKAATRRNQRQAQATRQQGKRPRQRQPEAGQGNQAIRQQSNEATRQAKATQQPVHRENLKCLEEELLDARGESWYWRRLRLCKNTKRFFKKRTVARPPVPSTGVTRGPLSYGALERQYRSLPFSSSLFGKNVVC